MAAEAGQRKTSRKNAGRNLSTMRTPLRCSRGRLPPVSRGVWWVGGRSSCAVVVCPVVFGMGSPWTLLLPLVGLGQFGWHVTWSPRGLVWWAARCIAKKRDCWPWTCGNALLGPFLSIAPVHHRFATICGGKICVQPDAAVAPPTVEVWRRDWSQVRSLDVRQV